MCRHTPTGQLSTSLLLLIKLLLEGLVGFTLEKLGCRRGLPSYEPRYRTKRVGEGAYPHRYLVFAGSFEVWKRLMPAASSSSNSLSRRPCQLSDAQIYWGDCSFTGWSLLDGMPATGRRATQLGALVRCWGVKQQGSYKPRTPKTRAPRSHGPLLSLN